MALKKYITLEHLTTAVSALLNKIAEKANIEDLSDVAFSGSYTDLENKPDLTQYVSYDDVEDLADGTLDGPFMIKGKDYVTAGQLSGSTLGSYATAEGSAVIASGQNSHAEGYYSQATGKYSHAEGYQTLSEGYGSHSEGYWTAVYNPSSSNQTVGGHSEGRNTVVYSDISHAEGDSTIALGLGSHTEGECGAAFGIGSHSEGQQNICFHGIYISTSNPIESNGYYTYEVTSTTTFPSSLQNIINSGNAFFTEHPYGPTYIPVIITNAIFNNNILTQVTVDKELFYSSRNQYTLYVGNAIGNGSHAEGCYTIALDNAQHAGGRYNIPVAGAEVIGGGTNDSNRANIRTLDWSGNETLAGKLTLGASPVNNMDAATKQYVDNASGGGIPSQSGNSGKFLTTNGTAASWATLDLSNYLKKVGTNTPYTITTDLTEAPLSIVVGDTSSTSDSEISLKFRDKDDVNYSPGVYLDIDASTGEHNSLSFDSYSTTIGELSGSEGAQIIIVPYGGPSGEGEMYINSGEILQINGTEWGYFPASFIKSGTLGVARGGTGLTASPSMLTNLGSTTAANVFAASPRPGVTGTLPIANGGTGGTTAQDATWNLLHVADPGNLNNAKRMGNFKISNTTTNTPVANMWGATWNIVDDSAAGNNGSSGTTWQLVFKSSSTDMWLRTITNAGGWSAYKRVWTEGNSVTGAVWNDYAEYRETDTQEFGRCVIENGDDTMSLSTKRLQKGCSITSDTWGFAQGQTEKAKTPIAVSGRVLAYPFEDKEEFRKHIGDAVCSGPEGTVSIMTDEEVQKYPLSIIGTISAVPDYEEWGGGSDRDPVKVNGRVWIRIK